MRDPRSLSERFGYSECGHGGVPLAFSLLLLADPSARPLEKRNRVMHQGPAQLGSVAYLPFGLRARRSSRVMRKHTDHVPLCTGSSLNGGAYAMKPGRKITALKSNDAMRRMFHKNRPILWAVLSRAGRSMCNCERVQPYALRNACWVRLIILTIDPSRTTTSPLFSASCALSWAFLLFSFSCSL